jgi:hypothetical protein
MTNRNWTVITKYLGRTILLALSITLLAPIVMAQPARVPIVSRARIGGYSEDIAFVKSGPLKDHIALLEGYEIYTVPSKKKDNDNGSFARLCGISIPEFDQFPNGLTFIESEGLFALNNAPYPDQLFLFDQSCTYKGTRKIQYLNSTYRPKHIEGLAYIPASSPRFPDHLLMVVLDDLVGGPTRIEVIRRDGVVVSEIFRADWPAEFPGLGLADVTFFAPDRLLVTVFGANNVWTMDFDGNILSGPVTLAGAEAIGEGVVQTSDGRLVVSDAPQSLLFYDQNLNHQSESDRHDVLGLNLNVPRGIAWNSDTNQFLITHDTDFVANTPGIAAVPATLDSATPLVSLSPGFFRQTIYLPGEQLSAVLRWAPGNQRAILLFNSDGTPNSQISLTAAALGQNLGQPVSLTYIPTTNEFVVGFNGVPGPDQAAERRSLRVISRAGALVRTIDLTSTGLAGVTGIEYFEDPGGGGGRLLIMGGVVGRALVTDLNGNSRDANGNLLREVNLRVKLGLITKADIAAITTGPFAGAFAVVDPSGGEVVIFRLD